MKISKYFGLQLPSNQLDFLDIELSTDNLLYLDPNRILALGSKYDDILMTLGTFRKESIHLIKTKQDSKLEEIWKHLGEPNETRLGMSRDKPHGKGVGLGKSQQILERIKLSKAVMTGLVEDLCDISLFVHYVGADNISDMATNIIKKHLANFTQQQCKKLEIPMDFEMKITYWDWSLRDWKTEKINLPKDENNNPIIFVPKQFISQEKWFKNERLYNHPILDSEIERNKLQRTDLIKRRKNGEIYVEKKDIKKQHKKLYKNQKEAITELIGSRHKNVLQKYKQSIIAIFKEEFRQYGYDPMITKKGL